MLAASEIWLNLIDVLSRLEPFGASNPVPLFCMEGAEITAVQPLSGGKHTKLSLLQNGVPFQALCFGEETEDVYKRQPFDGGTNEGSILF